VITIPAANSFNDDIEKMRRDKNLDYIDAVLLWCEDNKIEIEFAASLIKKDAVFKAKMQIEGENLNILKRGARLPI
jgi:hypothetical protein